MSRIFDAIRYAQLLSKGKVPPKPSAEGAAEVPDRRRSRRWVREVSVFVYGHDQEKEPFHEEAHTLNVNENGALLLLSVPVQKGQRLLLTNQRTQKEQDCRVIFLRTEQVETIAAGIAFPEANPDFWQSLTTAEEEPEPAA